MSILSNGLFWAATVSPYGPVDDPCQLYVLVLQPSEDRRSLHAIVTAATVALYHASMHAIDALSPFSICMHSRVHMHTQETNYSPW